MYEFYLFSLVSSLALLVLWQTLGKSKFFRRFFGMLFLIAIISYGFSLFDLHLKDFHSMKILFRDLLILTFASGVSVMARRTKIGIVSWLLIASLATYTLFNNREALVPKDFDLQADGELLVKVDDNSTLFLEVGLIAFLKKENITYSRAFSPADLESTELDNYFLFDVPAQNLIKLFEIKKKLSAFKSVEYIEENEVIQLSPIAVQPQRSSNGKIFNDPLSKDQWALSALNVVELKSLLENTGTSKRARLFILDTGIDADHEDLKDNYVSHRKKYDSDVQSHGTHCAGIAGAVSNNAKGVASMLFNQNLFTISAIKVLNDLGMGTQKKIIDGIIEAADNGADVISLSLGGRSTDRRQRAYEETVAYANSKGAIVIVAAGNSSMNARGYSPANTNGVIAVAAIDENKNIATFSNTVEDLRMGIAAPGVGILSTIPGNEYKAYNGTSMATPYVAGLVAIMKSISPDLTTDEIYEIMNTNGQFVASGSKSGNLIDPARTIKTLLGQ